MIDGGAEVGEIGRRKVAKWPENESLEEGWKTFTISMIDEGKMFSIAITCFVVGLAVGAGVTWLFFWLTRS